MYQNLKYFTQYQYLDILWDQNINEVNRRFIEGVVCAPQLTNPIGCSASCFGPFYASPQKAPELNCGQELLGL